MRKAAILLTVAAVSFAPQENFDALAKASLSQIEGSINLPGLQQPVEVLRDPWGVPHIYAQSMDDLFFAQGFVQAQDRLWQMELYRRTYEGRLAEILGPTAVRHDRLTRLINYRGPFDEREYGVYHPQAKRILQAFANGVNAYIAQAGENLPVEFKLTGIKPGRWTPEIALLRTQTAMPLGDARAELTLARNVARLGAEEANRRYRPTPYRDLRVPAGLDVNAIDSAVVTALSGLMTGAIRPALLPQYQQWVDALPRENTGAQENSPGSNNWVVSGRKTATGKVILANDPHRTVGNPSIRYIVHLNAPGWDLIGATEPMLPGVLIGHNGRIAWGLTIVGTDQADVYVEQLNPANREQVRFNGRWENLRSVIDTIVVKGQAPVLARQRFSRHGPVFHIDSVRNLAYAIRSTAGEPGTAGYLSALRYHAIGDCRAFLDAQVYVNAPTENMICGDTQGNIAWQASALSPRRRNHDGRLPVPGTGEFEWDGFRTDLPRELNPERGFIATANNDIHPKGYDPPLFFKQGNPNARVDRITEVLSSRNDWTVEDFKRLQHDSYSASAARALERFRGWTASDPELERARALLAGWDARYEKGSAAAALYSFVSNDSTVTDREAVLRRALAELKAAQGSDPAQWRWGRIHRSQFPHALVRAYDIRAVERHGGAGTVAATGATYREIIDLSNVENSVATNTPGQSGQPGSPFYSNLAVMTARPEYFPLLYGRSNVERGAQHRLMLRPR